MANSVELQAGSTSADASALLDAQKRVLDSIVRGRPLADVLAALCRIVEDRPPGGVRAAILLADTRAQRLYTGAAPSLPDDYNRAVDGIAIAPDVGTCCAAAARNDVVITTDIACDPAWASLRHLPLALGLKAAWSLPIRSSTGAVLGTFGTYFEDTRAPFAHERELVEVLSRTAALAVERDRAVQTLAESEARYRAMVEASPECVKLVAADGTLLQINRAGLRMVEAPPDAVVGSSIYEVIAPEHRAVFQRFNERVCHGESGSLEFEIIGRSGTRRWMESNAVPLATADGTLQLAVTRDKTERVLAERALEASRARLDYAVRLSGVGFWYCDLPFDELIWDERVKDHFFLPPDARVTLDTFYARIHEDDREPTRVAVDTAVAQRGHYDTVYRTVCPATGRIKWIRAIGGTTCDLEGEPIRFDGVTVDVSEQRLHQERLRELLELEQDRSREIARLYEQLREQDQRKDEFLATLAHELRNPLAPIRIGLEILDKSSDPEQAERTRTMMERQLMHLVRMVDDLLEVSRVTLGKLTLKKEHCDFRAVLSSALEIARPLIEASDHELAIRIAKDPLPLDVDPTRFAQVVANLLTNAAKYTPRGGRIQLTAETDGGTLVVRVSDNGVGIPSDMLDRIFDVFTQVGRTLAQARGGLGLGLTLVRRLVEMHGGTVEAASQGVGQGSTFTLRLPLAVIGTGAAASEAAGASEPALRPLSVLVVDDNEDAAECLAMLLELKGHVAHLANSGPEAIARTRELSPDVVLLDIGLPGLDGYEVAAALRAELGDATPWLIAITGFGAEEDRRRAHAAGFDRHLVKPISPAMLTDVLESATRSEARTG